MISTKLAAKVIKNTSNFKLYKKGYYNDYYIIIITIEH